MSRLYIEFENIEPWDTRLADDIASSDIEPRIGMAIRRYFQSFATTPVYIKVSGISSLDTILMEYFLTVPNTPESASVFQTMLMVAAMVIS